MVNGKWFMKNILLVAAIIIILIIIVKNKIPDKGSLSLSDLNNLQPIGSASINAVSTLTIPTPKISPSPSITAVNPNLIKYGLGILQIKQANGSTINLPYQTRDPLEAKQPPTSIVTSDLSDTSTIDKTLAATLPGKKSGFAPVSLGPTVGQQAQNLIDFYKNAPSGFGGPIDSGGTIIQEDSGGQVSNFV